MLHSKLLPVKIYSETCFGMSPFIFVIPVGEMCNVACHVNLRDHFCKEKMNVFYNVFQTNIKINRNKKLAQF